MAFHKCQFVFQAPYWLGHCRWLMSLNAVSWYFSPPAPSFSLFYIFIAVMNFFQRRRKKSSKGRVLLCPISFLLQFDLCQSLCLFELRFCFACCLLDYYNSGLHLSPESPNSWKIVFILRAREERFFSEKRKSRWFNTAENRAWAPKQPAKRKNHRDQKRRLTAVYHLKWFAGKGR